MTLLLISLLAFMKVVKWGVGGERLPCSVARYD